MPIALTHQQLCDAVEVALAVEDQNHKMSASDRYKWLTEAELVARVRDALLGSNSLCRELSKMQAGGRLPRGSQDQPDIVDDSNGTKLQFVYIHADSSPTGAAAVNGDLSWLKASKGRHVVAFIPRARSGYRIQRNKAPFDDSGNSISLAPGEHTISHLLQVAKLDQGAVQLFDGVIYQIAKPVRGSNPRWSVLDTIPALKPIGDVSRSCVRQPKSSLWALVWSHT